MIEAQAFDNVIYLPQILLSAFCLPPFFQKPVTQSPIWLDLLINL